MRLRDQWQRMSRLFLSGSLLLTGCLDLRTETKYLGNPGTAYYKGHVTAIEYPNVVSATPDDLAVSIQPHTVRETEHYELRPVTLEEAIRTALENAQIVRTNGQFLSPGNQLISNPEGVASIYDSAIQETGVLIGGRGVEAALAAFDAQLSTTMIWGRNETTQNNTFNAGGGLAGGSVLAAETATFSTALSKTFAHGGAIVVDHNVQYQGTNIPTPPNLFESVYTGNVRIQYRQPLLAGAGTEFTRIAGPISENFGGITGVSQGVVIARINNDITLARFEAALHNLVLDVENAYWDLYLAYRNFHTAAEARDAAQRTWELADKQSPEIITPADEAQARDQLYLTKATVLNQRSNLFTAETRLRRLMNLPVNDGTILQPVTEPVTAEVIPDWYTNLSEALANRVELRAQKWQIRSLELQLAAAKSLTKPQLDLIASYQLNGFGDQLFPYERQDAPAGKNLRSFYGNLIDGDEEGWALGFQMNMPIGFRSARAQVRNYELRLARARKLLAEQEKEIGHELAAAFQELARAYTTAVENYNRFQATEDNVRKLEPAVGLTINVDEISRAQQRRAEAEVAYYTSLANYNQALANLQFRKGTILAYNNVSLREGPWAPAAYEDAQRRATHRAYSVDVPEKSTIPPEFASPYPVSQVGFARTQPLPHEGNADQPAPPPDMQPLPEPAPIPGPADDVDPFAPRPGRPAAPPAPPEAAQADGIQQTGMFDKLWGRGN